MAAFFSWAEGVAAGRQAVVAAQVIGSREFRVTRAPDGKETAARSDAAGGEIFRAAAIGLLLAYICMRPMVFGLSDLGPGNALVNAVLCGASLSAGMWLLASGRRVVPASGMWLPVAGVAAVFICGAARSPDPAAAWREAASCSASLVAFLAAAALASCPSTRRALAAGIAAGGVCVAAYGIWQRYAEIGRIRDLLDAGLAPSDGELATRAGIERLRSERAFSTFGVANSFAAYLNIAILAWIWLALPRLRAILRAAPFCRRGRFGRPMDIAAAAWLAVCLAVMLWAFVLAESKGGAVALAAGACAAAAGAMRRRWIAGAEDPRRRNRDLGVKGPETASERILKNGGASASAIPSGEVQDRKKRPARAWMIAAVAAAAMLVAAAAAHGILPPSLMGKSMARRIEYWKAAVAMAMDHPLAGVGTAGFGEYYPLYKTPLGEETREAHNDYLQVLAEHGAIGLAFWLLLIRGMLAGAGTLSREPAGTVGFWTLRVAGAIAAAAAFAGVYFAAGEMGMGGGIAAQFEPGAGGNSAWIASGAAGTILALAMPVIWIAAYIVALGPSDAERSRLSEGGRNAEGTGGEMPGRSEISEEEAHGRTADGRTPSPAAPGADSPVPYAQPTPASLAPEHIGSAAGGRDEEIGPRPAVFAFAVHCAVEFLIKVPAVFSGALILAALRPDGPARRREGGAAGAEGTPARRFPPVWVGGALLIAASAALAWPAAAVPMAAAANRIDAEAAEESLLEVLRAAGRDRPRGGVGREDIERAILAIIEAREAVLEWTPWDAKAHVELADSLSLAAAAGVAVPGAGDAGRLETRAGELLEKACRLRPRWVRAWLYRGRRALSRGEFDGAARCFERAAELYPLAPIPRLLLGDAALLAAEARESAGRSPVSEPEAPEGKAGSGPEQTGRRIQPGGSTACACASLYREALEINTRISDPYIHLFGIFSDERPMVLTGHGRDWEVYSLCGALLAEGGIAPEDEEALRFRRAAALRMMMLAGSRDGRTGGRLREEMLGELRLMAAALPGDVQPHAMLALALELAASEVSPASVEGRALEAKAREAWVEAERAQRAGMPGRTIAPDAFAYFRRLGDRRRRGRQVRRARRGPGKTSGSREVTPAGRN